MVAPGRGYDKEVAGGSLPIDNPSGLLDHITSLIEKSSFLPIGFFGLMYKLKTSWLYGSHKESSLAD